MVYSYYPGCTLKTKAQDLEKYAKSSAEALGFVMEEQKDWQCCGAVYPMGKDELATKLSSVRALDSAKRDGRELLTLCSACHHVIKRVNNEMKTNDDARTRVNNYLKLDSEYSGETKVVHYLEVLRDVVGFDKLAEKVKKPLGGKKIAAYYGCMLLRPSSAMQFDDPENPVILENFLKAIGAEPVIYPFRNECCGGYVTLSDNDLAKEMSDRVMKSAKEKGAEEIITACPLCTYNLEHNASAENKLPVRYFTELLAEVLDVK